MTRRPIFTGPSLDGEAQMSRGLQDRPKAGTLSHPLVQPQLRSERSPAKGHERSECAA